jgi:hypothetical protein
MADPQRQRGPAGPLDAGPLGADIASFRLHLTAKGKAARTVQGYTSAVRWFAASYLRGPADKTQLGAGGRPRYPTVNGAPAGPL